MERIDSCKLAFDLHLGGVESHTPTPTPTSAYIKIARVGGYRAQWEEFAQYAHSLYTQEKGGRLPVNFK